MSIALQMALEAKFSKDNINEWVDQEIAASIPVLDIYTKAIELVTAHLDSSDTFYMSKRMRYAKLKSNEPGDIVLSIFSALLGSVQAVVPVVAMASKIGAPYFTDMLNAAKTGAELLGVIEPLGLFSITRGGMDHNGTKTASMLNINHVVADNVLYKIHATQYLPPMLVEPIEWTDNKTGGTYIFDDNCILGQGNMHDSKQGLDVLNTLQNIAWTFTSDIHHPTLKARGDNESSKAFEQRKESHMQRVNQSKYIYNLYSNVSEFYFVWKFDKRGRSYSQGYDINLQGSEEKKASIQFAKTEMLDGDIW